MSDLYLMNHQNCIEQLVSLLHQLGTGILVVLDCLQDVDEFNGSGRFSPNYQDILQERLSGVRDGH